MMTKIEENDFEIELLCKKYNINQLKESLYFFKRVEGKSKNLPYNILWENRIEKAISILEQK